MMMKKMNSDETKHHIPYNGICAPGFVSLKDMCVLNDRCDSGIYAGKVCVMDGKIQPYLKPLNQKHAGISEYNVICAEGLELILKYDGSPVCTSSETAATLIQRGGWSSSVSESSKALMLTTSFEHPNEQNGNDGYGYGYGYRETKLNDAKLTVVSKIIAGKNYLVFDGAGWHGLYNVEITIMNHDEGEQININ